MPLVSVFAIAVLQDLRSVGVVALICLVAVRAIARYWTPIRDIPGPFLASLSKLWQIYQIWKGHIKGELITCIKAW